jgi:signal transduction histidine kinase
VKKSASVGKDNPTRLPVVWIFILIFSLLVAGLILGGYFSYQNFKKNYRAEAEQQLSAIAELKVSELSQWRKERLADGAVFFKNDSFYDLVRRFLEQPEDADAKRQILDWIAKYSEIFDYNLVQLIDAQGITRLALPGGTSAALEVMSCTAKGLNSGQISITDFHWENNQNIYLSVSVPILDAEGTNRPLGVLTMQIDPNTYLYPFINRWPVPSATAETLLVRREGNDAVFLNPLRFYTNAALNLRIPLEKNDTPAVMAVLRKEGIFEGQDYRGVPVISALHAIPDSPWVIVARRDMAEVFAPLRARLWQTVAMIGILLFGATTCMGMVWRQQRVIFYREKAAAAEALYETQAILQTAMEQSPAGIAIADAPSGKLRYVNDVGLLIGGSSRAQLVDGVGIDQYVASWKIFDFDGTLLSPDNVPLARAIKYGETNSREFIIRRGDHDDRVVLAKAAPIINVHGQVTAGIVVFLDITERRETLQKLSEAMEHLRVSNRDLEQFAYIASHDLQEPLRMVANYMQLLERRYKDKLDQDAKDFIGYAVDGAVRMQQLIDSLLDYSRLQTRKNPFEMVSLDQVLQRVLRDLEGRILETGAQVTADPLPQVYGDALQIGLVFQNLITNAIKFRGESSPKVHISASDFSKYWKLIVRDNGIGIAPEHQERIFKIFQRLHSRAEYPGTGIGLAICRRIIERHGGETGVESELTKGSAFWFTLLKKGEK